MITGHRNKRRAASTRSRAPEPADGPRSVALEEAVGVPRPNGLGLEGAGASHAAPEPPADEPAAETFRNASAMMRRQLEGGMQGWSGMMRSNFEILAQAACIAADALATTVRETSELQMRSAQAGADLVHSLACARSSSDVIRAQAELTRGFCADLVAHAEQMQEAEVRLMRDLGDAVTARAGMLDIAAAAPVL